MCGIFGYSGNKPASYQLIEGLRALDYRGYDSWGIGVMNNGVLQIQKKTGSLDGIKAPTDLLGTIGIGHTRWATHGAVTQKNAHPHFSEDKSFILAQNGMVENYLELKAYFEKKGTTFQTQTDTEVIVKCIEEGVSAGYSLSDAVNTAYTRISGRNTIILLDTKGVIIARRNGSPLVIGVNTDSSEIFVSSDMLSFAGKAQKAFMVENNETVIIERGTITILNRAGEKLPLPPWKRLKLESTVRSKNGYAHFMLKEIFETPHAIRAITKKQKNETAFLHTLKQSQRVYTIGSGTAGIAASHIALSLRTRAKKDARALIAADCHDTIPLITQNDIVIAPSQSGETADVLAVLEVLKAKNIPIATLVNMHGAIMTNMASYPFLSDSGPEICVMSTKVFSAQIAWGYRIAYALNGQGSFGTATLKRAALTIDKYLSDKRMHTYIESCAQTLISTRDLFLLATGEIYPVMQEGMVKLIEGTYKHAHAIPAGDLKHYAITLIEKGTTIFVAYSDKKSLDDAINAAEQVRARGARVIGIGPQTHPVFDTFIPAPVTREVPALGIIVPLQLLAYYLARLLGNAIDKPRNIAKSVTVR